MPDKFKQVGYHVANSRASGEEPIEVIISNEFVYKVIYVYSNPTLIKNGYTPSQVSEWCTTIARGRIPDDCKSVREFEEYVISLRKNQK